MEIELPRRAGLGVLLVLALMTLAGLGMAVSPRSETGRPVLLSPTVRKAEQFRRLVWQWAADWRTLSNELRQVLEADGELLTLSSRTQRSLDWAMALARAAESGDAPAALIALQELTRRTGQAYVEAALAVARWVSAPTEANQAAALLALEAADGFLRELGETEWLRPAK